MGRDLDPAVSRWWTWGFPQISLWGGQCITITYKNYRVNQQYTNVGNALWFVPGISQVVQLDPNYCTCSVCSSWAGCRSILGNPGRTWAIHDTWATRLRWRHTFRKASHHFQTAQLIYVDLTGDPTVVVASTTFCWCGGNSHRTILSFSKR